jgi:hypothetical protein
MGGFAFSDFQFAVQPGSTGTPIDASAVAVSWGVSPAGLGIRFSSGGFRVGAGESVGYWLSYNIDPLPVAITGFGDALWIAPPAGSPPPIIRDGEEEVEGGVEALIIAQALGSVNIDTQLCVGGVFTGPGDSRTCSLGSTSALSVYYYTSGGLQTSSSTFFGAPVSTVGVLNSILLDGGESGALFWAMDNQAYTVPEPAGWLLVSGGLALLAFLRRRRAA